MVELYTCQETGALGFNSDGIFITKPFVSECGRFLVNPKKYYGLTSAQILALASSEKGTE